MVTTQPADGRRGGGVRGVRETDDAPIVNLMASREGPPKSPSSALGSAFPPDPAPPGAKVLQFRSEAVPGPPPSRRRPRRAESVRYRIKVSLDDSYPPIWRRLDVRSDLMLDVVHQVLQAAFGWSDGHLHRFASGGGAFDPHAEHYLCKWDAEEGDPGVPETAVRLDETLVEPNDILRYCYDYGDDWGLTIQLEAVGPADDALPAATCLAGRRAAPPEDCGSLRTAGELAEVLDDPAAFDRDDVNAALVDPFNGLQASGSAPDLAPELTELMRRLTADPTGESFRVAILQLLLTPPATSTPEERARAVRPILWFLHHVGAEGLALTSAGYLRPIDVSQLAAELPMMRDWIGLRNRETQTFPVMDFREAMQAIGLVRKNRGRLVLTKAGLAAKGDPERVWQHLLERLPTGSDKSMDRPSGWLYLVRSALGEADAYDAIADVMTALGWREDNRLPVGHLAARHAVARCAAVLRNLMASSSGVFGRDQIDPVVMDLCHRIIRGGSCLPDR